MRVNGQPYRTVWLEGSIVRMIDQRQLPHQFTILDCPTYHETAEAIRSMAVRGAGAIGVAAGFAITQAILAATPQALEQAVEQAARTVRSTRPTAHDLFYAVEQLERAVRAAANPATARETAVRLANRLADENASAGERIGLVGEPLLPSGAKILTQCNAGWLAFADWGSALAPIYQAHRHGKRPFVYVPETRPRSQGAKLTAWELAGEGIAHALIADTACGSIFQRGDLDCVIVGADRIAANGDVANKIGTYTIALLAHHHQIPFYVAAPRSTFDADAANGGAIVIEERAGDEVAWVSGRTADGTLQRVQVCPDNTPVRNPAFDVTPAALVKALITEVGIIPPEADAIAAMLRGDVPVSST